MRLRLEDGGGSQGVRTLYNKNTGQAIIIPLASKATRQARRAARERMKMAQINEHENRVMNRQTSRTRAATQRQGNRMSRLKNVEARHETTRLKIVGRRKVNAARQAKQIAKQESDMNQASLSPDANEGSDVNPGSDEIIGGDAMVNQDEQQQPDTSSETDTQGGELSAGFIDALIQGGKKLVNTIANSKAGQVVQKGAATASKVATAQKQITVLKSQTQSLQLQLNSANQQKIIYAAGSGAVGLLAGFVIAKATSKHK